MTRPKYTRGQKSSARASRASKTRVFLATGATASIMEKFSTSEAVRLLKTGEFTYFPGVPTMFHYLLQATRGEENLKFPKLRLCVSAGATMPATLDRKTIASDALLAHCRTHLSAYKVPHIVKLMAEIPRTGSGKIIRYKLRELLKT
jgi:acyl-CoA synthetase (AMP-forming)/AMP-acid ligase II